MVEVMVENIFDAVWQAYGPPALETVFFYCAGAVIGVGMIATSFFTYKDKNPTEMYTAQGVAMTIIYAALHNRPVHPLAFTLGYSTPVCLLAFMGSIFDFGLWRDIGHSGTMFRKVYVSLTWPLGVMWAVRWLGQE